MIIGILDDDQEFAAMLAEDLPYHSLSTDDPEDVLQWVQNGRIDALLTDLYLGDTTGLEVLSRVRDQDPNLPVVVMTGYGSVDTAVEAMKEGARDYVEKPVNMERLEALLNQVEQDRSRHRRLQALQHNQPEPESLVGGSEAIQTVRNQIQQYGPEDVSVLIIGESGSGRSTVARLLHEESPRQQEPFLEVDCSTLNEDQLTTEFFGGSAADNQTEDTTEPGRLNLAAGGTLVLRRPEALPSSFQQRLAGYFRSEESPGTHPRLIGLTGQNPRDLRDKNLMTEEMLNHLNVGRIDLPPLRDRVEDLPELIDYYKVRLDCPDLTVTDEALNILSDYDWPGNLRELRNLIERLGLIVEDGTVTPTELPPEFFEEDATQQDLLEDWTSLGDDLPEALETLEHRIIKRTLEETDGNKAEAARRLGISRQNLHYKINERTNEGEK